MDWIQSICIILDQNGPNWNQWNEKDQVDLMDKSVSNWTEMDRSDPNWTK